MGESGVLRPMTGVVAGNTLSRRCGNEATSVAIPSPSGNVFLP